MEVSNDVDTFDGLMMGLFGIERREIKDTYIKMNSMKHRKDVQKGVENQYKQLFNKGVEAQMAKDWDAARAYFKQAQIALIGGEFTPQEKRNLFSATVKQNKNLQDSVDWQYQKEMESVE